MENILKVIKHNTSPGLKNIIQIIPPKILSNTSSSHIKKYVDELFFIKNYFNDSNIEFDKRIFPTNLLNNDLILKTKLITWDSACYLVLLVKKLSLFKNVCSISNNYGVAEYLLYNKIDVDHYNIATQSNENLNNNIKTKMHNEYKFNDTILTNKLNKKYNCLIYDINSLSNNILDILYDNLNNIILGGKLLINIYANLLKEKDLLILTNIINCFKYTKFYIYNGNETNYYIYCNNFIKIISPTNTVSQQFYIINKKINKNTKIFNKKVKYIKKLIKNKNLDELNKIETTNRLISINIAKFLEFETYKFENNVNLDFNYNMQLLYILETPILYWFKYRNDINVNININTNINISHEINEINEKQYITTKMIDYREIDKYDNIKKYIRLYEGTISKELYKLNIKIDNKPVSRAWIKLYEILTEIKFNEIHKDDKIIKTFHICEAPGNFIHCLDYYIKKNLKNTKYIWNATTLKESDNIKTAFGDDYKMIANNRDKWTFGYDNTGDITKEKNIKYYKEMCYDCDWLIGDCGLPWDAKKKHICIQLYFSQILFILYNLKNGGNCIFKALIPFQYKLLIDMYYILFNTFEKILLIKPVQNKFSPEFYFVCFNYNNTKINSKQFDTLFKVLDEDVLKISIIESFVDDFTYQFTKGINIITDSFCETIEMQIFFVDFWDNIDDDIKINIKKLIDIKNMDFIKKYILIDKQKEKLLF